MQQVLNSQERNQAFFKFLLFFLVTIILIIGAVYFNYRMPTRENEMLQSEVDVQRTQDVNQQKFVSRMQEATALLDSLEKKGTNFEQIDLQLNSKMQELSVLQQKDNTIYGKMNKVIIDRLAELQQSKRERREAALRLSRLADTEAELEKYKQENLHLHDQLDAYRQPVQ